MATHPTMYEVRDAAKAQYDSLNVLVTSIVPERMRVHLEFMAYLEGLTVSDMEKSYGHLPDQFEGSSKIIGKAFYNVVWLPYMDKYWVAKRNYLDAQAAVEKLENLAKKSC